MGWPKTKPLAQVAPGESWAAALEEQHLGSRGRLRLREEEQKLIGGP